MKLKEQTIAAHAFILACMLGVAGYAEASPRCSDTEVLATVDRIVDEHVLRPYNSQRDAFAAADRKRRQEEIDLLKKDIADAQYSIATRGLGNQSMESRFRYTHPVISRGWGRRSKGS